MKTLLLLFTAFLLFSSCCKDIPTPAFTAEDLAWMPYKDGDTLKMNGSNGKQLWLRFSNMGESVEKSYPRRAGFAPCPVDKSIGRTFTVRPVAKLLANQSYDTTNFEVLNINGFDYGISRSPIKGLNVFMDFDYFDLKTATKIDILINGTMQSVYSDTCTNYTPSNKFIFSEVYISPLHGIVKFKFYGSNNIIYEIY